MVFFNLKETVFILKHFKNITLIVPFKGVNFDIAGFLKIKIIVKFLNQKDIYGCKNVINTVIFNESFFRYFRGIDIVGNSSFKAR